MGNANKEYKDRLFHFLFGREEHKDWTLSLYNAVRGSDYINAEEIRINTIDDVLYLGMHNDISFLIVGELNLFEQQSSFNPNMPLVDAISKTIDEIPEDFLICDLLKAHKAEVCEMLETEYNQEEVLRIVAEDAERRGEERGEERGEKRGEKRLSELIKKLTPGSKEYEEALNASHEELEELYRKNGIS